MTKMDLRGFTLKTKFKNTNDSTEQIYLQSHKLSVCSFLCVKIAQKKS